LFPEVKDKNKMYEMASLHGLLVRDEAYSGKRTISLFYNCIWNEEEGHLFALICVACGLAAKQSLDLGI